VAAGNVNKRILAII